MIDDQNDLSAGRGSGDTVEGGDDELDLNFDDNVEFDDFDTGSGRLSDQIRNNPLMKFGLIAGGAVLLIGTIVLFGGNKQDDVVSRGPPPSSVSQIPGTADEQLSPSMIDAIQDSDQSRLESAIRTRGSNLPTPLDTGAGLQLQPAQAQTEDPLAAWRKIQEEQERQRQLAQQQALQQNFQQPAQDQQQNNQAATTDALAQAMARQMETILESLQPKGPQSLTITPPNYIDEMMARQASASQQTAAANGTAPGQGAEQVIEIIVPAGSIEYGQLMLQANSDAKGPVLALIVSGPLAGSRMLGTFETMEEFLVLTFNVIVIDGISYPTQAVALNPDTANVGLVTDIDRRYFRRIILPAAARFVEGLGSAIADTGNTTTTINGATGVGVVEEDDLNFREELFNGVEEAARQVGDILEDEGDQVKPLITVDAGTPIGIMFLQPVTDEQQQYNR